MYRSVRPSGRNQGRISWPSVSSPAGVPGSASVGCPPLSATFQSLKFPLSPFSSIEKTIVPSRLHVPPSKGAVTLHKKVGAPPDTSTFMILPLEKKPMNRLSGDQNNDVAPSVPTSGRADAESSSRIRIMLGPSARRATIATRRPLGETTRDVGSPVELERARLHP